MYKYRLWVESMGHKWRAPKVPRDLQEQMSDVRQKSESIDSKRFEGEALRIIELYRAILRWTVGKLSECHSDEIHERK